LARLAWAFAALDVRSPQVLKTVERLHPLLTRKCAVPAAEAVKAEAAAKAAEKVMAQRARALGGSSNSPAGAAGSSSSTTATKGTTKSSWGVQKWASPKAQLALLHQYHIWAVYELKRPDLGIGDTSAAFAAEAFKSQWSGPAGQSQMSPALNAIGLPHRSNATRCGYLVECLVEHTKVKDRQDKERMEAEAKAKRAAEAEKEGGEGAAEAMAVEAKEKENKEATTAQRPTDELFEGTALVYLRESDHISGRHEVRPPLQLKLRQLDAIGWAACPVPYYEWVPLRAGASARLYYLQEVLAAAVAPRPEMQAVAAREAALAREHAREEKAAAAALKEAEAAKEAEAEAKAEEEAEAKADAMAEAMAKAAAEAAAEASSSTTAVQEAAAEKAADAVLKEEAMEVEG